MRTNDLTIRAATVNGSGSQSANLVLANAIFRLGIPVAPKNVFPSNIEGLPTWFDVRVSPRAYQCRSSEIDILVAMNPATWHADVKDVAPGAAIIYEETYAVAGAAKRDDVSYFPVPFAKMAKESFPDAGLRKYLTNMIYVGVLAQLLGIAEDALEAALRAQFKKKLAAVDTNMNAVRRGITYAREHLPPLESFKLEAMPGNNDGLMLMDGNAAAALGSLMAGCTVVAWYPITPSSSLCESFIQFCDRYRIDAATGERKVAVIQAEDELAAIGMVFGATWAGARAMTSTSGPGLSLMAEFAGLGYYAELPGVIFDIQRAGPSTGLPTRTMQGDVAFAYSLSHGDTKHVVLLPATAVEAYEFASAAFDLADRFQTPVFVLSDLDLGMNLWMTPPLKYPERGFDRGKVLDAQELEKAQTWARYRDVDSDGIPYRTLPGTQHPNAGYFTRGSGHDETARYSEDPNVYRGNLDRLSRKFETARTAVPQPIVEENGHVTALIAYGTTHHAIVEARDRLKEAGIETDYLRVRALPFSADVFEFISRHETVYVVEQNRDGQVYGLLRAEAPLDAVARLRSIRHYNGVPIDASAVIHPLLQSAEKELVPA